MTQKKQKQTQDADSEIEAFIAEVQDLNPIRNTDDLPIIKFERDQIHRMTVTEFNAFEGEYGPSVCVIGDDSEGTRIKTFFGTYEREAFLRFAEDQDLPVAVQFVRRLVESEKNPGRYYAGLYIRADA